MSRKSHSWQMESASRIKKTGTDEKRVSSDLCEYTTGLTQPVMAAQEAGQKGLGQLRILREQGEYVFSVMGT
jgi:hypothetical protein